MGITGQGRGASEAGRQGLTSWGESEGRGDGSKTGDKGSGSKGAIWHCKEVVIETVPEPGKLYSVSYTVEELLAWILRHEEHEWVISDKPVRHPIRTTGTRVILRGLGEGTGYLYREKPLVNPKEVRTAERLVAELAERLPPNAHRFVTITDYDGTTKPLQVRKIEGEPIIGEALSVPGVGDVSWDMAVVANRNPDLDGLKIGADGTNTTWQEFARLIRRNKRLATLLAQVDEAFGNPRLSGLINVPKLNEYRAIGSGAFEADIADDEAFCEGLLITLIDRPLPGVNKALRTDTARVTTDQRTFVAEIVQSIHAATGEKPTGPGQKTKVSNHKKTITVEAGETHEIEVVLPPGIDAVWNVRNCGGTLNVKRGNTIAYTAGKTCGNDFVLVANNRADATHVLFEIRIVIVERIPFAFEALYRLFTNERKRINLDPRAVRHTSGKVVIELAKTQAPDSPTDVRIEHKAGDAEAYVVSGTQTGFVEVVAYDRDQPTLYHASARVFVEPGTRDRAKPTSALDTAFVYNGRRYEVAISSYSGDPEALRHASYLTRGTERETITVNLDHPMFNGVPDAVRRAMCLNQISFRIAEAQSPDGATGDMVMQECSVIYATISAGKSA